MKNKTLSLLARITVSAFCSMALIACAPMQPVIKQLNNQNINHITLVVEKGPFQYTVPTQFDGYTELIGAITAIIVQKKLDSVNAQLITAAHDHNILTDHQQVFVDEFVQRLNQLGISVSVVSAPYKAKGLGWGGYRIMYVPDVSDLHLNNDRPAFALRLDIGSCSFGKITPCIRSALLPVSNGQANQNIVKFHGLVLTTPETKTTGKYPSELRTFENVDEAAANIADFDQALAKLVPEAVDELLVKIDSPLPKPTTKLSKD